MTRFVTHHGAPGEGRTSYLQAPSMDAGSRWFTHIDYGQAESRLREAEIISAIRAVKRDTVGPLHVACTREWWEDRRREHEEREGEKLKHGEEVPAPAASVALGIPVFVTDDVIAERGWEVRPGAVPGEQA